MRPTGDDPAALRQEATYPDPENPGTALLTGPACPPDSSGTEGCATDAMLEKVTVVDDAVGGGVNLVLFEGRNGIDAFNAVAGLCFQAGPECPTKRLALIVDGKTVAAPSIQSSSFDRDEVQVSGGPTAWADLAVVLNHGPLPATLAP